MKKRKAKYFDRFDFVVFILYKFLLDLVYIYVHSKTYAYYGFDFVQDPQKMAISWILFVILSLIIVNKDKSITTVFTYTIFLLSVVPCFTYYQYNTEATFPMIFSQGVAITVMELLFRVTKPKGKKHKPFFGKISYKNKTLRALAFVGLLGYFAIMLIQNGLPSLSLMSFTNISQVRAESSQSTLMVILGNLICKIVCPLFIFVSLREKKWIPLIIAVLIQVYCYGVTGFKTYLFIPLIIIGVNMFQKLNLKRCVVLGLPLVVIGATLIYVWFGEIMPYALTVERVIFLPAKIKISYFDFFTKNGFVWFKESTLAHFLGFESPYSRDIPYIIGDVYFGRPNMWTNAGFMADAYSNAGYFGIVLMCAVLYVLLIFTRNHLDNLSNSISKGLQAVFLLFFISLNDGGAISVIFSGGMIFLVLLIVFIDFTSFKKVKRIIKEVEVPVNRVMVHEE